MARIGYKPALAIGRFAELHFATNARRTGMMLSDRYAPPMADLESGRLEGLPNWKALETPATVWIKRAAAVGLAAGFFLPLTSCSGNDYSAANAYEWSSLGCCVAIILFFWPVLFEALLAFRARSASVLCNPWPRIVLFGCTFLGISWLVYWGQHVRYGALIAYLASGSYAVALGMLIRRRRIEYLGASEASARLTAFWALGSALRRTATGRALPARLANPVSAMLRSAVGRPSELH